MRTPMVASPHLSAAALTPRPPAAPAAPAGVRAHLAGDLVKGAAAPALQRHPLRRSRRPTRLPPAAANKWGNQNRLGEDKPSELDNRLLAEAPSKTPFLRSRDPPEEEPGGGSGGGGLPQAVARALAEFQGQLQYNYYNWRQDTWSDLQLILILNAAVFLTGAWVEGAIIRNMDASVPPPPEGAGPLSMLWFNLYKVLAVVLGQDLPEAGVSGWPSQLFAIVTAIFGLASFALVLALIEQVVLEILERNVKRGSMCYERGHSVVLSWCESPRDIAQLTRILTQLCAGNRRQGGGTVVVLTQQRGKLEMEQLYREVIPPGSRFGTQLVFRQGSPLDPAALSMVAAADARRVLVCTDESKESKDADAQVLRCAVLLDELVQHERPSGEGGPVIVAQIKTTDALPLLDYSCSPRVLPVPTTVVNARRYVRLLHNPIAAMFSRSLSDFYSPAHGAIDHVPEAEGTRFGDLHQHFPDAVVVGLCNRQAGWAQLNPPPDRRVQPGDDLVLLRPEQSGVGAFHALPPGAASVSIGSWSPERYVMRSQDEQPLGADACGSPSLVSQSARACYAALGGRRRDAAGQQRMPSSWSAAASLEPYQGCSQGLYVTPLQLGSAGLDGGELLIAGWMGKTFMCALLEELDHSDQALPPGSKVTLFNDHSWTADDFEARLRQHNIRNLQVSRVRGDPRSRSDMQRLLTDISRFRAAVVVCDSLWVGSGDRTGNSDAGLHLSSQAEMLSLDAAALMVQLNFRLLLEEAGHTDVSIITEKITYIGNTRFEDDTRLPLGLAVNSASYAAKALTQVAMNPRFLRTYMQLGVESDLTVQDASAFAAEGEELSFAQLQARAASVRQVLLGYYRVPACPSDPLELVVNPQGAAARSKVGVWNTGDARCKLVTLALTKAARVAAAQAAAAPTGAEASGDGSSGSGDGSSGSSGDGWQAAAEDFQQLADRYMSGTGAREELEK